MWITLIIGIIVDLLVKFLTQFFKDRLSWEKAPDVGDLERSRMDFVNRIDAKWYLGGRRHRLADKAFELAVGNYVSADRAMAAHFQSKNAGLMAVTCMAGVHDVLIEEQ